VTTIYWVQVLCALINAANVVFWGHVAIREHGFLRVIALPLLTWCLHSVLFFVGLFLTRYLAGGVLSPGQAALFNAWSTAIRLHGGLACLSLFWFVSDWRRTSGRG
jgi:hypothetical protein